MKTREQNRNNEQTEIERFDWFVERIQTLVAFGWLSECSREKTGFFFFSILEKCGKSLYRSKVKGCSK